MLHLPVDNINDSLSRVQEGGGKILKKTVNAEGGIASAVVEDPVGVCFVLVKG